jgi:hypothetical protein
MAYRIYVFPEMKLRGLFLYFFTFMYLEELYIFP